MGGVRKDTKVLGDKHFVTDYKAYAYYRDNSKRRKKENTPNFVEYGKIITSIYSKISEAALEYESGVYVKNMFYIVPMPFVHTTVSKIFSKEGVKKTLNSHTKGKIYTPLFFNLIPDMKYSMWSMDYSFCKIFKKRLSQFLKIERPNYKFALHTILKNK